MYIKDCIYGLIEVPEYCKIFLDTPEVQRLRKIKQLGLVCYVYPSATHTRFEHSIGVMHLAGAVADKLQLSLEEKKLLQIAGLLHDVGHLSFSHLMDYILETDVKIQQDHEQRSVQVLKRLNEKLSILPEEWVDMISCMILGDETRREKKYLTQILSYIDRMDYIQRDAYHIGLPGFRPDYIIKSMCVQEDKLCIKEKANFELECLYEARKRMFNVVYRHKTVLDIENVIRDALLSSTIFSSSKWDIDYWLTLTDYRVEEQLEQEHPDIMIKLSTRTFEKNTVEDRFNHVKYLNKDEIQREMDKIQMI